MFEYFSKFGTAAPFFVKLGTRFDLQCIISCSSSCQHVVNAWVYKLHCANCGQWKLAPIHLLNCCPWILGATHCPKCRRWLTMCSHALSKMEPLSTCSYANQNIIVFSIILEQPYAAKSQNTLYALQNERNRRLRNVVDLWLDFVIVLALFLHDFVMNCWCVFSIDFRTCF